MLERQEEYMLAKRWREHGDRDAAHKLAEEHITLEELAEEFSVSRERVRQIEVSAFEKVQNAVKHRVAAMGTLAPLQVR